MSTVVNETGSALYLAVAKLLETIEEENSALQKQEAISHAGYTDRKNQALRELMAAQRREATPAAVHQIQPQLHLLAQALRVNSKLLKHHISAVGEISDIIVGSLRDANSDGTYSRGFSLRHWR